jgi:hypothetical protein
VWTHYALPAGEIILGSPFVAITFGANVYFWISGGKVCKFDGSAVTVEYTAPGGTTPPTANAWVLYGGNLYTVANQGGQAFLTRFNGSSWTEVFTFDVGLGACVGLATDGTTMYALFGVDYAKSVDPEVDWDDFGVATQFAFLGFNAA